MATVQKFEDLEVWQLGRALENSIFLLTNAVDFHNDYDLIRQMRRSTGSIMDNIAEGFGRGSRLEFVHSLSIAKGEACELQSQLYRSRDRGYIPVETQSTLYHETEALVTKLKNFISYLNVSEIKGQKFMNR